MLCCGLAPRVLYVCQLAPRLPAGLYYSKNSLPQCNRACYFCYSKSQLANVAPAGKHTKRTISTSWPTWNRLRNTPLLFTIVHIACLVVCPGYLAQRLQADANYSKCRVLCVFASLFHVCQLVLTILRIAFIVSVACLTKLTICACMSPIALFIARNNCKSCNAANLPINEKRNKPKR